MIAYQHEKIEIEDKGVDNRYLLTAAQMAHFVTDGFLIVKDLVPDQLNEAVYRDERTLPRFKFWFNSDNIRAVFDQPRVKGIIQGLVGLNPVYDHSALHIVDAGHHEAQNWHADSIIDLRPLAFDGSDPGTTRLPPAQSQYREHRALQKYPRTEAVGVKGRYDCFHAPRHLALRPAKFHRPDPLCL